MNSNNDVQVVYENKNKDYSVSLEVNTVETIVPGNPSVSFSDAIYTDSEVSTSINFSQGDTVTITSSTPEEKISYKYAEDRIISDFKRYIDKTYGAHYQTENNVQAFDAWIALGDATPTFRNTAVKYLWRYGKKNSNDKDDLLKTLHYTLMCLYNDHYKDAK
jgi:hypothetical protein